MISPEGLSVPALLDAAAERVGQRGPAVRVPEAACLRSVAVAGGGPGGDGRGAAFQSWESVVRPGASLARRIGLGAG